MHRPSFRFCWLAAFSLLLVPACGPNPPDPRFDGLDQFLDELATRHGIPGYSFSAFDSQGILYQRAAGYRDAKTRDPVDSETVFEAASISKPVFAYIVSELAKNGALDLDVPIGATAAVNKVLGHDPRSASITPRMLLSHTAGLPNWRARLKFEATSYDELFEPDQVLQFVSDPGTEYRYSGEGYVLLQQVVEQQTGRGLDELAHELVFDLLGMNRSSFLFDASVQGNSSRGHDQAATPDKWTIGLALSSSTLHTTASDLALFGIHLSSGILRGEHFAGLVEPQVEVGSGEDWKLEWGLGLGMISEKTGSRYLYHGGNNVIFLADFIYGFEENLGYALLTNSANGQPMIEAVERRVFGKDIPRP